jgi:ABC-2 type transport system ATP-binding protein
MRQRLGLAAALLGEPQVLILDEPTNGLDPAGVVDLRELLRVLTTKHGTTILLSSHQLAEVASLCDRVAIMHRGSVRAEGTPALLAGDASLAGFESAFMEVTCE